MTAAGTTATGAASRAWLRDVVQLAFRSFPFATEPGLRVFGSPDRSSPVFVTCNFDYTVRRVSRVISRYDCYLLVAPTGGMNVWCASAGGHFGTDEVEAAIRLSGIEDLVDHHRVVLPRLTAPGVDTRELRRRTGWRAVFGPIEIDDLPAWLDDRFPHLVPDRVTFPAARRAAMGAGAALWPAGLLGLPAGLIEGWRAALLVIGLSYLLSVLFALAYPCLPRLALRPGVPQAVALGAAGGAAGFGAAWAAGAGTTGLAFWSAALAAAALLIATDFPSWSPTDVCKQRLLCFLYPATLAPAGFLPAVDEPACLEGCDVCVRVCPKGALALNEAGKATLTDPAGCLSCYACVQQCPVDAIS